MKSRVGKWVGAAVGVAAMSLLFSAGATAATLDCTVGCLNQSLGGALFTTVDQQSTGTGVISSFVRISAANQEIVDGHNTSGRPLLNDENSSPTFTHDLQLSQVPTVTIGGTAYYEFLLDINQTNEDPGLTLDSLQICLDSSGGLVQANTCPSGPPEYNLDASGDNAVALNYNLNSGSGSGDLKVYIPVSALGVDLTQYVYLYSLFGSNSTGFTKTGFAGGFGNNDGFEEWAVRDVTTPPPTIPEPATILLFGTGLTALARVARKRRT